MKKMLRAAAVSLALGLCSTTILASNTTVFPEIDYVHFNFVGFPPQAILNLGGYSARVNNKLGSTPSQIKMDANGRGSFFEDISVNVITQEGSGSVTMSSNQLAIGCGIVINSTAHGDVYAYQPICQHLTISPLKADPVAEDTELTVTYNRTA